MAVADQDILDAIDAAILAIITGKAESISANGRAMQKLGIDKLQEMKREYEARISSASAGSSGGGIALVQFGEEQ
jgi:hypothetical protein